LLIKSSFFDQLPQKPKIPSFFSTSLLFSEGKLFLFNWVLLQ